MKVSDTIRILSRESALKEVIDNVLKSVNINSLSPFDGPSFASATSGSCLLFSWKSKCQGVAKIFQVVSECGGGCGSW